MISEKAVLMLDDTTCTRPITKEIVEIQKVEVK